MNNNIKKEIFLAIGMFILTGMCIFYTMPQGLYIAVNTATIAFFLLFAVILWTSKMVDERAYTHRALSSDVAFTVGGVILGMAMIYQLKTVGHIDVWIIATLAGMIFSRVISQIWLDKYR